MAQTLVAHSITIKQYDSPITGRYWRIDWEDLKGSHIKWFDTFAEVSRFIEGDLLA